MRYPMRTVLSLVQLFILVLFLVAVLFGAPFAFAQAPAHTTIIWQDAVDRGTVALVRVSNQLFTGEYRCFLWFQGTTGWGGNFDGGAVVETACPNLFTRTSPDPIPIPFPGRR